MAPAPTAAWELCRGLGRSFGYNAQETAADTLTGTQLVHLLADVVAHGGNLLINVGPNGTGHIPDLQQQPLHELGAWLDRNGEAIYGTRRWTPAATTTASGDQVRFTHKDRTVYAIVLSDRLAGDLIIRGLTLPPAAESASSTGPQTSPGPRRPATSESRHPHNHPASRDRSLRSPPRDPGRSGTAYRAVRFRAAVVGLPAELLVTC